jgi:hypothetical protein
MGLTLIMIGTGLLGAMCNGAVTADFLLKWWPVVFILLGGEILVYLFLSKQEQPVIRYRWATPCT